MHMHIFVYVYLYMYICVCIIFILYVCIHSHTYIIFCFRTALSVAPSASPFRPAPTFGLTATACYSDLQFASDLRTIRITVLGQAAAYAGPKCGVTPPTHLFGGGRGGEVLRGCPASQPLFQPGPVWKNGGKCSRNDVCSVFFFGGTKVAHSVLERGN